MNERKKIYGLYLSNEKYIIKIENTSVFDDSVRRYNLLTEDKQICKWNSCLYLSFSKKILKEKAKEVREQYITEIKKKIAELHEDIERLGAMKL